MCLKLANPKKIITLLVLLKKDKQNCFRSFSLFTQSYKFRQYFFFHFVEVERDLNSILNLLLHSFQQIFCQNDFMRNILSSFKEDWRPSAKLNIFCPDYTSEELQYLVDFLYEGEFSCDNPEELEKISFILNDFGYSTDMKFSTCQNGSDDMVFPQVQPSIEISPSDITFENSGISEHEAVTLEVILDPICFELNTQNLDDQNSASSINEMISNLDTNNIFKDNKQKGKLQTLILSSLIFLNQSEIKIDEHIQY